MALRFARSLILGLLLGAIFGLYLGWIQFPSQSRNSSMGDLSQRHRDDYTVMIAAGYSSARDLEGARERLRRLEIGDLGGYLQDSAERIIRTSAHDLNDIRLLVQLARDMGQLTPAMQPYLDLNGGDP